MIANGTLTYSTAAPTFFYTELSETIPNLIAIAAVTTVLSYQVTALITDLLLGFEPNRVTSASALHTLLLVRSSSPIGISANIFRSDVFTRAYYGKDIPRGVTIARDGERIRAGTVIRLFTLLFLAPLVSVASVLVTLSSRETVSFADAGFDGLGIGFSDPGRAMLVDQKTTQLCGLIPLHVGPHDASLAEFAHCSLPITKNPHPNGKEAGIGVAIEKNSSIFMFVAVGKVAVQQSKAVSVHVDDTLYFVQPHIFPDAADRFLDYGMEKVAKACDTNRNSERNETMNYRSTNREHIGARFLPCEVDTEAEASRLATAILEEINYLVTLVDANTLMVAKHTLTALYGGVPMLPYFDGSSLPLLSRRRPYLSLSTLAVLTVAVAAARAASALFLSNDVGVGLDRLVKETLGYCCCDFLLDEKRIINFSSKQQEDNFAHFGLPQGNMTGVETFSGGILGKNNRHGPVAGVSVVTEESSGDSRSRMW